MSDLAIGRRDAPADIFRGLTVALLLLLGVVGFTGMLLLGAYAPDLRSGRNGGTHALSRAAIGLSGIVELAGATGRNPRVIRNSHEFGSEDLLVVSPDNGFVDVSPPLGERQAKPTALVFPKWSVEPDAGHPGWVRIDGLLPREDPGSMLAPGRTFRIARRRSGRRLLVAGPDFDSRIRFPAPPTLQVITGIDAPRGAEPLTLRPLLTDGSGGLVVGKLGDRPLYLIADPDLLSNAGIRDPRTAAAALALLDWMNSTGAESVGFDVTTNGLSHSPSPLKLAFEPPFLALTIVLAAVLLLVGLHALGRFGPVRPRARAIAFGKSVLVDNSAAMVRRAGFEARLGGRYVQVIRERAVATFGVPARLKDTAVDAYLDELGARERSGAPARFTDLARAAEQADDKTSLVFAARALYDWQRGKMA